MSLVLAGCAAISGNQAHNAASVARSPDQAPQAITIATPEQAQDESDDIIAMSFSGGGWRAAAFSLGALQGLASLPGPSGRSLLKQVRFITAVSGGSLTGAWVGLNGTDSLAEFRKIALLHGGKHELRSGLLNTVSLLRLAGDGLPAWLDDEVFHGATFSSMRNADHPVVWINATNLNQRLPFVFTRPTFDALCSDLDTYPVADAVAASMAVPLVFSPVVLEKHPEQCATWLPKLSNGASSTSKATLLTDSTRSALTDYRDLDTGRYVKLVDGGLTDNFGLSSIPQMRLLTGSPLTPLSEAEALHVKRLMFIVVDGGRRPAVSWSRGIGGPGGFDLALASIDAAIDTNMRLSYDNFVSTSRQWQDDIVAWRCGRPDTEQEQQRLRRANWRCDDVKVSIERISFDSLPADRAQQLHAISTSLTLPPEDLDSVIAAGNDAARDSPIVQSFSSAQTTTR